MPIEILMPALSPTMEEGTLSKWLVKEGDTVNSGDVMAEIETDKATMEIEAVDEGVIAKILVGDNSEGVKVNAPIAILLEDGEDASALDGYVAGGSPALQAAAPTPTPVATPAPQAAAPQTASAPSAAPSSTPSGSRIKASPLAKRLAKEAGIDLSSLTGSGPNGRIVKADIEAAKKAPQAAATPHAMAASHAPAVTTTEWCGLPHEAWYSSGQL